MFKEIKEQVDFLELYNFYLGDEFPLKQATSDTIMTEDDVCPWHGGHGSFRIKYVEDDREQQYANCFGHCHFDGPADHIEFVRRTLGLDSAREAAERIIADFKLDIQSGMSVSQKIFFAAAEYYRDAFLLTNRPQPNLQGKTPVQYQIENRGHLESTLNRINIGWTDGGLCAHLLSLGFSQDSIINSGLGHMVKVRGQQTEILIDYFMAGCFIYPHYVQGRPSDFTIKHMPLPGKERKEYRLKNSYRLNNPVFYGMEDLNNGKIAIVEGENDRASLIDAKWDGCVLCCNGQLKNEQLKYIQDKLADREIFTFFDADEAGTKYIEKMWKVAAAGRIPNLYQFGVPEEKYKDIDDFIKNEGRGAFIRMIESGEFLLERPSDEEVVEVSVENRGSKSILVKNGRYYAVKVDNEGGERHIEISNFIIKPRNTYDYVEQGMLLREVVVVRYDGRSSRPMTIDSAQKTSLRLFKQKMADIMDCAFKGTEQDLANMWDFIQETSKERNVQIVHGIGHIPSMKGWLFGNVYVSEEGAIMTPDNEGVIWVQQDTGIMARSPSGSSIGVDVPCLKTDIGPHDIEGFLDYQGKVLRAFVGAAGSIGAGLTMLAWSRMQAESDSIHASFNFVPFLHYWGKHGKGKSTMAGWLTGMWDMHNKGVFTVGNLRSTVGFERLAGYYRSLPMAIDELRADEQALKYSDIWRGYYNRYSRVMASRELEGGVKVNPIHSNFIFCGQDTFADPAMAKRCVTLKMPEMGGDAPAFNFLTNEHDVGNLSRLGFHWILEAARDGTPNNLNGIREYEATLEIEDNRARLNWSVVGFYAERLAKLYYPDFDFKKFIYSCLNETMEDVALTDLSKTFWQAVAVLMQDEMKNPFTDGDFKIFNNQLRMWSTSVIPKVLANHVVPMKGFSASSVRSALAEEPYYAGKIKCRMHSSTSPVSTDIFEPSKVDDENFKLVMSMFAGGTA